MKPKALITGITGQDGSYLTEFLLEKGYEVHGIVRRISSFNTGRIEHLLKNDEINEKKLFLHYGDLTDSSNLSRLVDVVKPDEVYNLAAQSHVKISFDVPEYTAEADSLGVLRILEAVRRCSKRPRFYQASTSELFGGLPGTAPQSENTPFHPRSPYAAAKLYAYWITVNYREAYGLFACNGILFNHESPRRGENFVTRKITKSVCNIMAGRQKKLTLGNLDAIRDWGFAGDYVEAMWLMLQQDKPDDYVIATGNATTVRNFVELAFKEAGIDIEWSGFGIDEKGYDKASGRLLVDVSPVYFRPSETEVLLGDPSKAERQLGWYSKVDLKGLVKMMVEADYREITVT